MGVTERVRGALKSMIKLEDQVVRQSDVIKAQQTKIESLTERMIRMETTSEEDEDEALAAKYPSVLLGMPVR